MPTLNGAVRVLNAGIDATKIIHVGVVVWTKLKKFTADFTGTDGAALSASWYIKRGGWEIRSNAARGLTTNDHDIANYDQPLTVGKQYAVIKCNSGRWTATVLGSTRETGYGTLYLAGTFKNGSGATAYSIERRLAGVGTMIADNVAISGNPPFPLTFRGELDGGTIRCFVNGTLVGTHTDAEPLTGQYAGINQWGAGADLSFTLDDFECGELA